MFNPFNSGIRHGSKEGLTLSMGQWRVMHPFPEITYRSDKYYLNITQRIADIFVSLGFKGALSDEVILNASLSLAAYFEDVVSELGLFRAFVHRYREVFHNDFPWYKIEEEYFDDEVNLVDVRLVLWLSMYASMEEIVPNPENPEVEKAARQIYDLLLDEFEKAPVNQSLVDQVYDKRIYEDPGNLKALFIWMSSNCYLLQITQSSRDSLQKDLDNLHEIFEPVKANPALAKYLDCSYAAFRQRRGPLALYPKDWYALMRQIKGHADGNKEILKMDVTGVYPFVVVKIHDKTLTMTTFHGQKFEVNKNSFSSVELRDVRVGDIVVTSLFSFKGHWNLCGVAFTSPIHDLNLALEKLAQMEPSFKDTNENYLDIICKIDERIPGNSHLGPRFDPAKCEELIKLNNGDRMFYFENIAQADRWVVEHLNPPKEFVPDRNIDSYPIALYINDDYQLLIAEAAFGVADPKNPYYSPEDDGRFLGFITDTEAIADEMVEYMVERNYTDRLKLNSVYGPERAHKLLQDNLRFFLTFSRQYPFYK